jgi:hypothetical protein
MFTKATKIRRSGSARHTKGIDESQPVKATHRLRSLITTGKALFEGYDALRTVM